jgi:hypothetical protein
MEALLGFAVGYLMGARDGREGLRRVLDSWEAISRSDEFRGLVATALTVGGRVAREGLTRSGPTVASTVAGLLLDRARDALVGRPRLKAVG